MMFFKQNTKETGNFGEDLALRYLKKKGLKYLESNFKCKFGEIDLIFRDKQTLVFIEVKLRRSSYYGEPALYVTPQKQKKIIHVAKFYLQTKKLFSVNVRFDVVGITKIDDNWQCSHIENAFITEE